MYAIRSYYEHENDPFLPGQIGKIDVKAAGEEQHAEKAMEDDFGEVHLAHGDPRPLRDRRIGRADRSDDQRDDQADCGDADDA